MSPVPVADGSPGRPGAGPASPQGSPARIMTALVLAVLSYALMQTMLVPTIGVLQRELHTTAAGASWAVLSSTLLASAVLTPVVSRLGDSHGRRKVLVAVLVVYLAGTIGCAAAWDIGALIAFRAVQGVSLSVLPLAFGLIREALPADRVAASLGITSGLVGGAAGVGLVCGGLIADHASWRWLFVAGAVLVAAALLMTRAVPAGPPGRAERLDLPGAGLFGLSLTALLLALTEGSPWGWTSGRVLGLFGAAVALFAAFVVRERMAAEPMIDVRLLTQRPILVAHLGAFMLGANQFVFYVLVPKLAELPRGLPPQDARLLGYGFGMSVTGAGLVMVPGTLLGLAASSSAGRAVTRRGPAAVLGLGLALAAAGGALLAAAHAGAWQVTVIYALVGAGSGLAMAALPALIHAHTRPEEVATANGVNTVARTVGGAVGSQLGTAVLASAALPGTALPAEHGFTAAFAVGAGVAAVGALLCLAARVRARGGPVLAAPAPAPGEVPTAEKA